MSLFFKVLVFSQNKKMSRIKKRKQFHREKHILLESNQLGKNIVEGNMKKQILSQQKPWKSRLLRWILQVKCKIFHKTQFELCQVYK